MRLCLDHWEHVFSGTAQRIPGSYTLIEGWQDLKVVRELRVLHSFQLIVLSLVKCKVAGAHESLSTSKMK
jgi:hypothetical protein